MNTENKRESRRKKKDIFLHTYTVYTFLLFLSLSSLGFCLIGVLDLSAAMAIRSMHKVNVLSVFNQFFVLEKLKVIVCLIPVIISNKQEKILIYCCVMNICMMGILSFPLYCKKMHEMHKSINRYNYKL